MLKCDSYTIRCGAYGFRVIPKPVKIFSVVLPEGTYETWWRNSGVLKTFLPKKTKIICAEASTKNDLFCQNPNERYKTYLIHFETTEDVYARFIRKVLDWKNAFPYHVEKPMLDFVNKELDEFRRSNPDLFWIKDQYGVPFKVKGSEISPSGSPGVVNNYLPQIATHLEVTADTDLNPVITPKIRNEIKQYIDKMTAERKTQQSIFRKIYKWLPFTAW